MLPFIHEYHSHRPSRRQQLRLHQHRLHRLFLQVRWVAVFVEDAFDHHADFCAGAFAQGPVDGDAFADLSDEFGGDDFEFVVAHGLYGGFIGGEGVVEGDFVVGQAEVCAAFGGGVHFLGQFDEFFDHFLGGDGAVVVSVEGLLEFFAEEL